MTTRSAGRGAIVPLILEARGLDVSPAMIDTLRRAGDEASAAALETIYREEIGHVAIGYAPHPARRGRKRDEGRGMTTQLIQSEDISVERLFQSTPAAPA